MPHQRRRHRLPPNRIPLLLQLDQTLLDIQIRTTQPEHSTPTTSSLQMQPQQQRVQLRIIARDRDHRVDLTKPRIRNRPTSGAQPPGFSHPNRRIVLLRNMTIRHRMPIQAPQRTDQMLRRQYGSYTPRVPSGTARTTCGTYSRNVGAERRSGRASNRSSTLTFSRSNNSRIASMSPDGIITLPCRSAGIHHERSVHFRHGIQQQPVRLWVGRHQQLPTGHKTVDVPGRYRTHTYPCLVAIVPSDDRATTRWKSWWRNDTRHPGGQPRNRSGERKPRPLAKSPLYLKLKAIGVQHSRKPQRGQDEIPATPKALQIRPSSTHLVLQHHAMGPRPAAFGHRQVGAGNRPPVAVTRNPDP